MNLDHILVSSNISAKVVLYFYLKITQHINYFALHFALICTIISAVALVILIIMASCGEELQVATPCIYLVTMLLDIPVYLICKIKNNHQEQKLRHKDRIIGTFNKFINFKEQ